MLTSERHEKILSLLEKKKTVHIEELVKVFDVSTATIRRDLDTLEKDKKLKKVYGGATFISAPPLAPYQTRFQRNQDLKEKIGKAAAELINDGDCVMFDIGSTALAVARHIKTKQNITVLTNSISIINEMMNCDETFNVFCLGGMLKRSENALIGPMAAEALRHFRMDKAILSCGGVTSNGLMNYNTDSAFMHSLCSKNAKTRILAVDSSKFGRQNFIVSTPWDEIEIVVTDSGIPEEYQKLIGSLGKQLIIVD